MNALLTLTAKNQLTLPTKLAIDLNLKKGSKFWAKVSGNTIQLEVVDDSWSNLQGILAATPMAQKHTVLEAIEIARAREAERLAEKHGR